MSILPETLERYRKFFAFIIKYWNSDITNYMGTSSELDDSKETDGFQQKPEEFVNDLKEMGPTYVKLGQLLSTRPDLLPNSYLQALTELQDDVESIPYSEVEKIFEEEIGVKISKAFEYFDQEPMASASIGQVHKAKLRSGKEVAVKIQRPDIRERFKADLETLTEIARWATNHSKEARKYNVSEVIDELQHILMQELDYKIEAQNLSTLKNNLREFKYLFIPEPIPDYSSSRVLTMEFVNGRKVTKVSPVKLVELDLKPVVDDLVEGYLKQIIVDGFAHADPHPGNVNLMPNNHIALMDLGMVARFTPEMQEHILQLLVALNNYDSQQISEILLKISKYDENEADINSFKKHVARMVLQYQNTTAKDMETGRLVIQLNRMAAQNGIQIPVALNILGKILLNMDQIVAVLDPDYNLNEAIRKNAHQLMQSKMVQELKPDKMLRVLLESKKFAETLPERLNKILESIANNNLKINIDAIDETRFTRTLHKVANRITVGIIIAAMIIGAALLIQIPTDWKILGYPGLAILLFLFAALLGFYLIYTILVKDKAEE